MKQCKLFLIAFENYLLEQIDLSSFHHLHHSLFIKLQSIIMIKRSKLFQYKGYA